jgi:ADP-ribosylglycohydrolase
MKIRYLDQAEKLAFELRQVQEEGMILSGIFAELHQEPQQIAHLKEGELDDLLYQLSQAYSRWKSPNPDPFLFQDILKTADSELNFLPKTDIPQELYEEKVLGGWLGRAAGCLLGKPIEKYSREAIREILQSNGQWPLNDYFTAVGVPADILQKYPWKRRGGLESLRENIVCMPEDDDLNYTMLNLHILESHGPAFTSEQAGEAWLQMMPALETFTAERIAYVNLLNGLNPPQSATHQNPFREWIGAQIRADLWGYVSPGNPLQAAELAWRDGQISHSGNGLYAELYFAAVIATAFTKTEIPKLLQSGLAVIPINSRLAQAIRFVLENVSPALEWESVLDELTHHFGKYHWVHSINNSALVVAALLHGDGDYEKTICNAVMGGWDTDCNAATAGSILGVLHGAKSLPAKWIQPLQNRVRSSVKGFDNIRFTELAQRTVKASKLLKTASAGEKTRTLSDDF